jgi:hypothetical protein
MLNPRRFADAPPSRQGATREASAAERWLPPPHAGPSIEKELAPALTSSVHNAGERTRV